MCGRLFSPAPTTKTRHNHRLLYPSSVYCARSLRRCPQRAKARPAQSHIEGENTPPGLTIVRCRGSRFPPSSLVGVASSPRTCSPHLRSRSTACFRPFAEQVIPSLSIIVFSSRTLFIPLTKHTTPSPIRGEHKIKHL